MSEQTYVVEQSDGRQIEITPLSNSQTIETFYGYERDSHPHAHTTTDISRSNVSELFLWDGPNGLSLVMLHDRRYDSGGGDVTFRFSGLPDDGEWVIRDDDPGNDTYFSRNRVEWHWGSTHTDGGVFRDVSQATITIDPSFYNGIDSWQVLSGSTLEPDRYELSLDDPVTVKPKSTPGVSGSASVLSWVPGLSEDDTEPGGDDNYSAFPNEGPLPIPLPIDEGFVGDKARELPDNLEDALESQKTVQGLGDREFNQYRLKNTLEISYVSRNDTEIDDDHAIDVRVNCHGPDTSDIRRTWTVTSTFRWDCWTRTTRKTCRRPSLRRT